MVATKQRRYDRLFVGGEWVKPSGSEMIAVVNPTSEEPFAWVPSASVEDAERATRAAASALPAWSATPMRERADVFDRIANNMDARVDEIASIVSQEVGTPIQRSLEWQARQPVTVTRLYAQLARRYRTDRALDNSLIIREPVGVVACITPWNFPLHQIMLKVAPALAAGCTVVLKPSSLAPLTAFVLAELIERSGLPPGVFNLVSGPGESVGEALATSPHVHMVSFTGSTSAGTSIGALAAERMKRVLLELGGKSASLVLEDADLEQAVSNSVDNCYANAGQTCAAWTRLIVPRGLLRRVEEVAVATAERYILGDPLDAATTMGPLVSANQRDSVVGYIGIGIQEGANLLTGGIEPPSKLERGYFVQPTVFSNVGPDFVIARSEIFGPVLAIQPYDTVDEGVRLANDSLYGLSGAVWSADTKRALSIARQLQTGQVFVNGGAFNYNAPFGGHKQSGIGREFGEYGLEEYLELKAIQLPTAADAD
ncbi:MAG TPA: aldehyde dehydrogenase family protein [Candidatus Dormibacteraeota bacterium]|nr:aldehyde dehydrogenase family protein [Candidatus Dormibacteraeota bacterium]